MAFKDKETHQIDYTVECIEELAKIVKENDLGRIKVSTDDFDIVVEGKRCPPPMHGMPPMAVPAAGAAAVAAVQTAVPAAENAADVQEKGNYITSPIIGTFYTSPSPEKPCFVKVGDNISAGDVVCIIESMKLMNEISSEFSGRVAEVYVNNGDSVEFGQKLMRIE